MKRAVISVEKYTPRFPAWIINIVLWVVVAGGLSLALGYAMAEWAVQ